MPAKTIWSDLDFQNTNRIRNLPSPANDDEPARMAELKAAVEGLAWKDNARVATQGNINLTSPGATIDTVTMATGDRVLVRAQTAGTENGIYVWNGSAVAMTRALDANAADELESAVISVDEGTSTGLTYRQSTVNFTLGTGTVTWGTFGTSAPIASETQQGIAQIATQTITDAGTNDAQFVTPLKLANWSGRKLKNVTVIGDGTATQFDVTHNLGQRSLHVRVYRNSVPWDDQEVFVSRPDIYTVRINMNPAPATNSYSVVITG